MDSRKGKKSLSFILSAEQKKRKDLLSIKTYDYNGKMRLGKIKQNLLFANHIREFNTPGFELNIFGLTKQD